VAKLLAVQFRIDWVVDRRYADRQEVHFNSTYPNTPTLGVRKGIARQPGHQADHSTERGSRFGRLTEVSPV
jgi:hypothetical protein